MGARILNGATATGAGPTVKSGAAQHAVIVSFTGTVTVLAFQLEGRIAGGAWILIGANQAFIAGDITAKCKYYFLADTPVDDIRVNVTSYTGTGPVYADYKSEKN